MVLKINKFLALLVFSLFPGAVIAQEVAVPAAVIITVRETTAPQWITESVSHRPLIVRLGGQTYGYLTDSSGNLIIPFSMMTDSSVRLEIYDPTGLSTTDPNGTLLYGSYVAAVPRRELLIPLPVQHFANVLVAPTELYSPGIPSDFE